MPIYLHEEMLYQESQLSYWIETEKKQRAKDEQCIDIIARYFNKGSILELGGGCGQLKERILQAESNLKESRCNFSKPLYGQGNAAQKILINLLS